MKNYDGGYKKLLSQADTVKDLINGFVREDWVERLDFETLEKVNASYVADNLKQRHDDLVWKVRFGDEWLYVYILLECQTSIDRFMSVRMMAYVSLLYQDLVDSKQLSKNGKLPPVVPIVLYNGDARWTAAIDVFDVIEKMPGGNAKYAPHLRYLLVDEGAYDEAELASMKNIAAYLFQMEKSRSDELADELLFDFATFIWERPEVLRSFAIFFKRVYFMSNEDVDRLLATRNPGEFRMMYEKRREEMIQRAESRGRAEGEAKGEAKGRAEGLREAAKRMLAAGMSVSQVAEFTNLSEEQIQELRDLVAN